MGHHFSLDFVHSLGFCYHLLGCEKTHLAKSKMESLWTSASGLTCGVLPTHAPGGYFKSQLIQAHA